MLNCSVQYLLILNQADSEMKKKIKYFLKISFLVFLLWFPQPHFFLLNTDKINNVLYMTNIKDAINSIANRCFPTKSERKIYFCWQVVYEQFRPWVRQEYIINSYLLISQQAQTLFTFPVVLKITKNLKAPTVFSIYKLYTIISASFQ